MPLHEWKETFEFNYSTGLYDLGTEHSPTTWIFEAGSFVPCGKIVNGKHYSIITDHLGTPIEAYNQEGELIWEREQDLYGNSRQGFAKENFRCPFKYQGQYYDSEVELCYNRFRYYQPETGRYISEDPIKLLGGFNVFAYVSDTNAWVDELGLIILQQVPYDNHPLSDRVEDFRRENPEISGGRNVAVAELNNGDIIITHSDRYWHFEKYLLEELEKRNALNDVRHLYTELEPCSGHGMPNCYGKLDDKLPKDQIVMFSYPYPISDKTQENKKANQYHNS